MSVAPEVTAFAIAAAFSLAASRSLVVHLDHLGERFCVPAALVGFSVALAADAPEVTSAVAAMAQHKGAVSNGVVFGSNMFNLATLLGLACFVAGGIAVHRKAAALNGAVAVLAAGDGVAVVTHLLAPLVGLALVVLVLVPYVVVMAQPGAVQGSAALAERWPGLWRVLAWLSAAIREEEQDLGGAAAPFTPGGPRRDALAAVASLVVVVAASTVMERTASSLGQHFDVPGAVTGGVALAAITSLPNVVAALHLARRGRGPAVLSEALNSNTLNMVAGLIVPAALLGKTAISASGVPMAWWCAATTLVAVTAIYVSRGVRNRLGVVLVASYLAFVGVLAVT